MEKTRTIIMLCISVVICLLFTMEALAAVNINLKLGGAVKYTARDLGAEIAGTVKVVTMENGSTDEEYMTVSQAVGQLDNYGVLTISGTEENYETYAGQNGETEINTVTDTIEMYIFIRNMGARPFQPTINAVNGDVGLNISVDSYVFSSSQTNPIALIRSGMTAPTLCSTIDNLTLGTDYAAYIPGAILNNGECYFAKVTLSIDNTQVVGGTEVTLNYFVDINLMLDIQYITDERILSVSQTNNVADPSWQKMGYNENLTASAIKAETKSITALINAYSEGINNNANLSQIKSGLTFECDDYDTAPVYKDIDIVNIDIATGEVIGKLSDLNYPFEWCGGTVTLPSGAVLASGRELTQQETFTVDVYTYYPTLYVRRWNMSGVTYLSVSDEDFSNFGFIKVDAHYVGTCEAVTYNPDKSVAYNEYGIITRSYLNGFLPLVGLGNAYCENSCGFTNSSGYNSRAEPRPAQMLAWADNLTKKWNAYALNNPTMAPYTQAATKGVAGNDWHEFVYQILYLIKYANFNSQECVGQGFASAANAYSKLSDKYLPSEKVGGTIGLRDTSKNSTNTANSSLVFNDYGMGYANENSTPFYAPDFLTYNNGTKRILRDGYVGTNGYTSVCCLGKFNPWGCVWNWVMGVSFINDSNNTTSACYVQFDEYDGTNYYVDSGTSISGADAKEAALLNLGYVELSFLVPMSPAIFRYLGVSTATSANAHINAMLTLVGLPIYGGNSNGTTTTGLCDIMATRTNASNYIYTLGVGNQVTGGLNGGLFSFSTRSYANHIYQDIGLRTRLLSAN